MTALARKFDATSIDLLKNLQRDARITNAALSERVGLAPSAVHERVKRLWGSGVIRGACAVLDRASVGLGVTAFVHVRTDAPLEGHTIGRDLAAIDRVLEVHDVAGADCFLLKVVARDIDDLHALVNTDIGRVAHVVSTSTTIAMKTLKETTIVPVECAGAQE